MHYDTKQNKRQTTSQLQRRGLMKPGVGLTVIGIYPMVEDPPAEYDPEIHVLTENGVIQDGDICRPDWQIEFKSLADVIPILLGRLANKRWQVEIAGTMWGEYPINTDRDSQGKLTSEFVAATSGLRQDGDPWKMKDGEFVPLTNVQITEVAEAMRTHVAGCFTREGVIKAAISVAETPEAAYQTYLDEIDTGWPATVPE